MKQIGELNYDGMRMKHTHGMKTAECGDGLGLYAGPTVLVSSQTTVWTTSWKLRWHEIRPTRSGLIVEEYSAMHQFLATCGTSIGRTAALSS
jgi:hypothetical protein